MVFYSFYTYAFLLVFKMLKFSLYMRKFFQYPLIPKHFLLLVIATCVATTPLSTVTANAVQSQNPEKNYIVVLRNNAVDSSVVAKDHAKRRGAKISSVYHKALKGYAARMSKSTAQDLSKDPNVAFVEEDGVVRATTIQTSATWGLDRIDQRSKTLNATFNYVSTGTGVKAYVIDTGIRASHVDLAGRVLAGYDAVDGSLPADDCNGHGTHVAGTIGGTKFGVAKKVQLVPVRVLDCTGSGTWSGVIAGIDFVTANHLSGQPAIANMSLEGGFSSAVNLAVSNSIADGVSYAVAAGNSSKDSCLSSPASVSNAMTIGATDKNDMRASWSNYGKCVDWFAPGVNITSDWNTSDTASATLSGTSMATPHTAGVAALYLQKYPLATPKQVSDALYALTTKYIVTNSNSTNNHLLFSNL